LEEHLNLQPPPVASRLLLLRRRRKARGEPYSLDVGRYSVYPPQRGRRASKQERPSPGDRILLRITALDENGRGIGFYKGFRVIVEDALPGSRVEAIVTSARGGTIQARLARILGED